MTKTSRKVIIFMVMLILVSLYFISGTYARYTSGISGSAAVSTAGWAVAFKDENGAIAKDFTLNFTPAENANVASGKIAPSVTAKATINLDLTGTEVAVDVLAEIDPADLATAFGDSADDVTVSVKMGDQTATNGEATIELVDNKAFTSTNGKVDVEISLTWANDDGNTKDAALAGQNLAIPVTLTVQQHIGN